MPSQRLLKMMDPLGHLGERRTLASTTPTAIVWAPDPHRAAWIAVALRAAKVEPLRALAFRHVETCLRAGLRPVCAIAVLDGRSITDDQLGMLITARWAGYRGPIVVIGTVAPRWIALAQLDVVAADAPLDGVVTRLLAAA